MTSLLMVMPRKDLAILEKGGHIEFIPFSKCLRPFIKTRVIVEVIEIKRREKSDGITVVNFLNITWEAIIKEDYCIKSFRIITESEIELDPSMTEQEYVCVSIRQLTESQLQAAEEIKWAGTKNGQRAIKRAVQKANVALEKIRKERIIPQKVWDTQYW